VSLLDVSAAAVTCELTAQRVKKKRDNNFTVMV